MSMFHEETIFNYHGEHFKLSIHRGLPYVGLENLTNQDESVFYQGEMVYELFPDFDEIDEKEIFIELLSYL